MGEDVLKGHINGYSQGLRSYTPSEKRSNINAICVRIGSVTFFYSYQTLIAIAQDTVAIVRENLWGPTTGKHIGYARQYLSRRDIDYYALGNDEFVSIMEVVMRLLDKGDNDFLADKADKLMGKKFGMERREISEEIAAVIGNFNPVINEENIGLVSGG